MKPKYSNLPPCPYCGGAVDAGFIRIKCSVCSAYGPMAALVDGEWINPVILYYTMHPRHAEYERARRVRQSGCIVKRETGT